MEQKESSESIEVRERLEIKTELEDEKNSGELLSAVTISIKEEPFDAFTKTEELEPFLYVDVDNLEQEDSSQNCKDEHSATLVTSPTSRHDVTSVTPRCSICNRSFLSGNALDDHLASHLRVKRDCYQCGRHFSKAIFLLSHVCTKYTTSYRCPSCRVIRCETEDSFLQHVDACMRSSWHAGKPCGVCGKKFPTVAFWCRHIYTAHVLREKYECTCCGRVFHCTITGRNHLFKNHMDAAVSALKCSKCRKFFSTKRSLQRHFNTFHNQVQKFHCTSCPMIFATAHQLRDHAESHLNKVYKCTVCGFATKKTKALSAHLKSHSEESKNNTCGMYPGCSRAISS